MAFSWSLHSQDPIPPAVKNNFTAVTAYDEMWPYLQSLDKRSDLLTMDIIGRSVNGKNLYALMYSATRFGKDRSKIRVLIFAQQHGNEQSGKEAALLLAAELLKPENRYLFDRIDLALVPQVNPDGSELNQRRNANQMDLNRNHLILTEPETMALHALFDRYRFEVTLDVHEYYPYGGDWEKYGYRKNSDVTVGTATNPNVSEKIRKLSDDDYLPYIFRYLHERDFSSFVYCPGGPPELAYIRHSTFDINDGRQSFAIQNTFSFIQEGMNGEDSYLENLRHRAGGQMVGMRGLLEYTWLNCVKIKDLIAAERELLVSGNADRQVSIQSEHASVGSQLVIPLFSYSSKMDTLVRVNDYRPVVRSISDVTRPYGYLIPKGSTELISWARRQSFTINTLKAKEDLRIEQYFIAAVDSIDFEGDTIINPKVSVTEIRESIRFRDYYFLPVSQLNGNLIILALEPKSMLGLATYEKYSHLIQTGKFYPVLRVLKK